MPKLLRYFPAKDCRHRIAVLALYRALIRTANGIKLPDSVLRDQPHENPILDLIRRRFHGNKDDGTSLRLVYSSITAGYKMLDVLYKAQSQSPEFYQILDFLRKRQRVYISQQPIRERVARERSTEAIGAANPVEKSAEDYMIRNVAGPFEPARYEGKARPRSTLTKRRRIPILCTEAYGFPFLRYGPSQPEALSKMVRSQIMKWRKATLNLMALSEEPHAVAQEEDIWEENLENAWREEQGMDPLKPEDMDSNPQSSYQWANQVARLWYEMQIELTWQDWTARGEALARIVEEEKRLQKEEDREEAEAQNASFPVMPAAPEGWDKALYEDVMRKSGYRDEPAQPTIEHPKVVTKNSVTIMAHKAAQPSFAKWLRGVEKYRQLHRGEDPPEIDVTEPYCHPIWGYVVEFSDSRIRKLIACAPGSGNNARFYKIKRKRGGTDDEDEGIVTDYAALRSTKG